MRLKTKTVPAGTANGSPGQGVTAVGATDPISVEEFDGFTCYVQGITTGTVQIQISPDGTLWVNEGSALTSDGSLAVSKDARFVRGNITVDTDIAAELIAEGRVQSQYS